MSENRADFLSRLFSRRRPAGLKKDASAEQLFAAFALAAPDDALLKANGFAVERHLTRRHGFPLTPDDMQGIRHIQSMFHHFGPDITYASSQGRRNSGMPSYAVLLQATDGAGRRHGYLSSHDVYASIREMQERNLIVPVVGDFAGPKALRAIGRYVAEHRGTVAAFYTSNVEQYLFQNGVSDAFYANLAELPLDEASVIIRSPRGGSVLDPILPLLKDVADGKIRTYADITSRGLSR